MKLKNHYTTINEAFEENYYVQLDIYASLHN